MGYDMRYPLLSGDQRRIKVGDVTSPEENGRERSRPALETVGDPLVERSAETDVEKRPDCREYDRHHEPEDESQSQPDREPTHPPPSRRSR